MRVWLYALGFLLVGCGADDDGSDPDSGPPGLADAAPFDAAITDASAVDASAVDAVTVDAVAVDAASDGGLCHTSGFGAAAAAIRQVPSLPAATGGVIQPGTYDAVDGQTTGALTGTIRSTWVIGAGTIDVFEQLTLSGTPPAPVPRSFAFTTTNTRLVRTVTCGGTTSFDNEYSVRVVGPDVLLDLKQNTIMFTFKKR